MYAKYFKRLIDFSLSLIALITLSPLLVLLIILGAVFMRGNPFFTQERPGKNEKIFKLIKFRTMDNRKDKKGNLLPDEVRLNKYGRFLRASSLDELPELANILKGDSGIIGTTKKNLDFTGGSLAYSNFVMIIFLCVVSIERGNKYKRMVSWMLILTHTIS